jgi:hypothetical protein
VVKSWRRAAARQLSEVGHTFMFDLSDGRMSDGSHGGNSARLNLLPNRGEPVQRIKLQTFNEAIREESGS